MYKLLGQPNNIAAAAHVCDEWVLPFVIHGSVSDCTERLHRLIDQYGFSEFLLPVFEMNNPDDYIVRVGAMLDL